MPAPSTMIDMIELDWPLIVTPSSDSPYPRERARISANITAVSGMNRKIGER